jgi:RNA 3'-terminal phosphate cyclase
MSRWKLRRLGRGEWLIDARFVHVRAINLSRRVHFVIGWIETAMTAATLNYSGHLHFRHRLVLAVLSGKVIKIDKIRPGDKNPGLRGMLSGYCPRGRH